MDDALAQRLGQYVQDDRGIALLMTARNRERHTTRLPRLRGRCPEAGDAFAASMAADPVNPVYPMNAAWVARLTGDADRWTGPSGLRAGRGHPARGGGGQRQILRCARCPARRPR